MSRSGANSRRPREMFFCCVLICQLVLQNSVAGAADAVGEQALIIPHTHYEGLFKNREETLGIGLPHILKALYLLKKYPDYRFVLNQVCNVGPFLERYPSEAAAFRQFITEGRLQIVGGTNVEYDTNIPSGEAIVRQHLFGKQFFREQLGIDVSTGWALDTFGHNAQMPQILRLMGLKSYWFSRGVSGIDTPTEFIWQGLDGTQIPAFWLPFSFALADALPESGVEFGRELSHRFELLDPFSGQPERALLAGDDLAVPEEGLPAAVDQFSAMAHRPIKVRFAVPAEFEALAAARANRRVIQGELNPIYQGGYSSRIDVKQNMREIEGVLTAAEKLTVVALFTDGRAADFGEIERAWEPVLFNQQIDIVSGTVFDAVYDEAMERYRYARSLALDASRRASEEIVARIDTSGKGVPVVVFNTLSWQRTDVVEAQIAFSEPDIHNFELVDSEGLAVPWQKLSILRNGDGGISQARIAFIARKIPALGYAVFHAVPTAARSQIETTVYDRMFPQDFGSLQNEFYRATFNLVTGAMTSLQLKESNWEVLAGPGNVVAREYDGGDLWELNGTLNGLRSPAMTKPVGTPRPAYTQWSNDFFGGLGTVSSGPVFSEFYTAGLVSSTGTRPFGRNQFATRVRLYQGIRRIDINTVLLNQEEFVRYRAVFPTTISRGVATHEIPFGAIQRPQNQEYPAQNWIDYGDGHRGVTLVNRGIPGNNVAEGKLMLSLMRSARMLDYPVGVGGYEPGASSDGGLGVGRRYTLEYALIPHSGDWRSAKSWRDGMEFNAPLMAHTAAPHAGHLPSRWGLLDISQDNVVISALKLGRGGVVILRVYEAAGKPAHETRISFRGAIGQVDEANLLEDTGSKINSTRDGFSFDLKPFEIKTFKLSVIK